MGKTKFLFAICVVGLVSLMVSCSNTTGQDSSSKAGSTSESGSNASGEATGTNGSGNNTSGGTTGDNGENNNGNNPTEYIFHETVEYLPAGTDGTVGTAGTYVLFGDWPQTIKAGNVEIDETKTMTIGKFTYYLGSDQNWYASRKDNAYAEGYFYSDGTPVEKASNSSTKYFKVEPIKWRVLNPNPADGEKRILLAENCLDKCLYSSASNNRTLNSQKIPMNSYRYSNIRAYLNGTVNEYIRITRGDNIQPFEMVNNQKGFLYSAFTVSAINKISDTVVKTDSLNPNICEDTEDKIFLPSYKEIYNSIYGFSENAVRIREVTDYLKSYGVDPNAGWFLRDLQSFELVASCVTGEGNTGTANYEKNKYAIVPALCLK